MQDEALVDSAQYAYSSLQGPTSPTAHLGLTYTRRLSGLNYVHHATNDVLIEIRGRRNPRTQKGLSAPRPSYSRASEPKAVRPPDFIRYHCDDSSSVHIAVMSVASELLLRLASSCHLHSACIDGWHRRGRYCMLFKCIESVPARTRLASLTPFPVHLIEY